MTDTPPTKTRRHLLATGAATALALGAAATARAQTTPPTATTPTGATPAGWNDGLAHPIPYTPPPGAGKERGLALGGGGVYLLSWMMGYFHTLKQGGVDLATADIIVGTSAGSMAGAMLAGGRLWRLTGELDLLGDFPKIFAELVPALQANESQQRARRMAVEQVRTPAMDHQLHALGRERLGGRQADAAARPGDDRDLAAQVGHPFPPRPLAMPATISPTSWR